MLHTTIRGHKMAINEIDINSSDQLLASASDDEFVRIWDLNGLQMHALKEIHVLKGHQQMVSVKFSPNGYYVAASCIAGRVWVWASHDGQEIATLGDSYPFRSLHPIVNFVNDENIISPGLDGLIHVWQFGPKGGQCLRALEQHYVRINCNNFCLVQIVNECIIGTRTLYRYCQ